MKVILVCIGNFQDCILDNIANLIAFGNTDITVIMDANFFPHFGQYQVNLVDCATLNDLAFNGVSNLDREFRNGFLHYCSLRFFYLYSYIRNEELTEVIYLENDVMCYANLDTLKSSFYFAAESKMMATYENNNSIIPGIIYIPHHYAMSPIIDEYMYESNTMVNLGRWGEQVFRPLPIIAPKSNVQTTPEYNKVSKHFDRFGYIFDAIAIGQYLGGVDPANQEGDTSGFVNEMCVVKYNQYEFYWVKQPNELYCPHIKVNGQLVPILNLHIHCKNLRRFMGRTPAENQFIHIAI